MNNKFLYNCMTCKKKCDGTSKGDYQFKTDLQFSQYYEDSLVERIIEKGFFAKITELDGYPDVEVYKSKEDTIHCYIEVKAQRRTFMSVKKILPNGNLIPSETMALNLSDLKRYFEIQRQVKVPIYLMWVLKDRPCVLKEKKVFCYYQSVSELEKVYKIYGDKRTFRRKSGNGDVVNGEHKGVVVNYHFSLNELLPFSINGVI